MNRLELGELLNKQRKNKKLTLKEMAKLVDVSFPYLSDIEKGGLKRPSYDKLIGVAKGYDVELQLLLDTYFKSEIANPEIDDKLKKIYADSRLDKEIREKAESEHPGAYTKLLLIELHEKLKKSK